MSHSRMPTRLGGGVVSMRAAGSGGRSSVTAGALASALWVRTLGVAPVMERWQVEIGLETVHVRPPTEFDIGTATRFQIGIYSDEWGVLFCHAGHVSWIRVTDVPFVQGRDEFHLLAAVPSLMELGDLVRTVERQNSLRFSRNDATIATNLTGHEEAIGRWVRTL